MRFLLSLTIAAGIIALVALGFLLNFTSPTNTDGSLITINVLYFFTSLFVFIGACVTVVLYSLETRLGSTQSEGKEQVHKPKLIYRKSLRRAALASGVISGIGLLNAYNLSNPLNIILLLSASVLIEIYLFGH